MKVLISRSPAPFTNDIPKICILSRDRYVGELKQKHGLGYNCLHVENQTLRRS